MNPEELRRIYDLDGYTLLNSGDVGYIPLSEIKIPIDHPSFGDLPKTIGLDQLSAGSGGSSTVVQAGRYTPTSRIINRPFAPSFTSIPTEQEIKVYRMAEIDTGVWVKQQVVFYYPSATPVTVNGFSIVIDNNESLTGVIVEYKFS